MTEPTSHCPDCGTPLPADSPQALCPACLMKQALASRTLVEEGKESPASPPISPEALAEKFPGFEILECLGRGGMGVVYKARQKSLGRLVAIKILPPERVGEAKFADRFAIEAATLAKLSHPNIVTVHDFGEIGGLFYIVMEYVDGVNLRDLLREGKLEPKQALAIVPPICDALQFAHDKGIVHRDIKPENLLLDKDGRVKIADFGIASLMGAAGEIAGTPPYMAPEQNGANIDHRADIYALGVVLYEMLTGQRPDKELIAPSRKVQIDVRLDEMVLRALEKEPERRYQTASEFRTIVQTMAAAPAKVETASRQLLKSGESLFATPEFLATVWGAMKLHEGMGTLLLFPDRLGFQAGLARRIIPLADIRRVDLVKYPFFQSPAGLRSIRVEFEDQGANASLVLTPANGYFSFVGTTNNRVLEWFASIREAITSATGNSPAGSHSPIPYQGLSADGRFVSAFVMLASFAALFGVLTALAMTGSWRNLLPAAIPFIFAISFVLALAWRQRRQWLREHPLPEQPPDSGGHLPGTVGFTVIVVVLLLVLTGTGNAMGMMIGAGLALLIGLIGFAKGSFRMGLLVALASLGVAGTMVMLINRKQAAPPPQSGSAVFCPVVEIALPDPAAGRRCVLDFETGKLLEPPAEVVPVLNQDVSQLPPDALRWLRDHGADAVLSPDGSVRLIEGVVFNPIREGRALAWDDFTPDTVVSIVAGMSEAQRQSSANQAIFRFVTLRHPAAVTFTTRERSCGVLQILGASEQPHGLRIRYKLVQNPAATPPLPPGYQPGHNPPLPPAYEKPLESQTPTPVVAGKPENADSADEQARKETLDAINAINDTNRFLDLELAVIDAKAGGLGDKHPTVIVAADVLARFRKTNPNVPETVWRQVVGQRLDKAKADLLALTKNGLGHAHPTVVVQQARIRALEEMMGKPELVEAPAFTLRWVARPGDTDAVELTDETKGKVTYADGRVEVETLKVARNWLLEPSAMDSVMWGRWNGEDKELFITLKHERDMLALSDATRGRLGDEMAAVWNGAVVGRFKVEKPLSNGLRIPLIMEDKRAGELERELKTLKDRQQILNDKVLIEDLALHMIVAIRGKDDAKLKSLAADRIKGWSEALPTFAVELREHYRQIMGDEKFEMKAGESLVDGDFGAVRCTGPAALQGKCLVMLFVKTDEGWKNQLLRSATENIALKDLLADFRKQMEKLKPAEKPPGN